MKNRSPDSLDTTLPFSHSDRLSVNILGLVSEGKTLDSRFKDICDVASAGAEFEYQATALSLSKVRPLKPSTVYHNSKEIPFKEVRDNGLGVEEHRRCCACGRKR